MYNSPGDRDMGESAKYYRNATKISDELAKV